MCTPKSSPAVQGQIHARGSIYVTSLVGKPILAYGASEIRFTGYQKAKVNDHAIKPRYRKIAVREANPDGTWNDGTAVTDELPFSEDLSLSGLGSFMFVQPGLANAITSANAGEALAYMQAFVDAPSAIVVTQRVVLGPWINTSQDAIIPLGNPFMALGLSGVMVAVAARGISGSPKLDIVTRTYEGDPSLPSAWDTTGLIGTDKTFSSVNEDYNTGSLTFAPADVATAQLGAWLPAVDGRGTLDFIIAAKW